ncbi:hypothetical protein [Nakamurella sp.]|uniref:hypothetical protein n=1 Tax=Nakamurella sp. TaxID=1869182 RepID=UPI00378401A9
MTSSAADPAAPIGITAHELRYLFNLEPTEVARANRRRFSLPEVADESDAIGAGAATLLVRGLARVADGTLVLDEITGLIGYVITHARVWTELALLAPEITDGALILTADDLSLLFTPRSLAIFEVVALRPGSPVRDTVLPLARAFLDESDDRIAVVRASTDTGEESAAVVRIGGDRWRVAHDVPRPGAPELPASAYVDRDRVSALADLAKVVTR